MLFSTGLRPWVFQILPFPLKHSNRLLYLRYMSNDISRDAKRVSRFQKLQSRLPQWLQRYTSALKDAPVSYIMSFLVLHEITAVVPLFSLAAAFHYFNWLPPFVSEWKWASDGAQKFGNYFRKKGWIGASKDREQDSVPISQREKHMSKFKEKVGGWWTRGEVGSRLVVEVATAYAITKALLPLRLPLSVWATPWFARTFVTPPTSRFRALFSRSGGVHKPAPRAQAPPRTNTAASTGATTGHVLPVNKKP